jgi:hypothetical protein
MAVLFCFLLLCLQILAVPVAREYEKFSELFEDNEQGSKRMLLKPVNTPDDINTPPDELHRTIVNPLAKELPKIPVKPNKPMKTELSIHIENDEDEKDLVLVDGDILLNKEQAAIFQESGWDGLVKSQAWASLRRWDIWIPVVLSSAITGSLSSNMYDSLFEIMDKTCVRFFYKRDGIDKTWIHFKKGSGCYTYLGRPTAGVRSIYLSYSCGGTPGRARTPAHEVMHTMGRYHEQTRPDRDSFVTISSSNTCPSQMYKQSSASTFGIPYDYGSVMHYSRWQCASSYNSPSMSFPSSVNPDSVGQRARLSDKDVQHIKKIHCPSMMMRLVNGEGPNEGRIEVYNNYAWGSVCSDGFDETDGKVACNYLGFPGLSEIYTTSDKFGAGTGPIWMNRLQCKGDEFSPFDCLQREIGSHDCDHEQDVGLKCMKAARLVGSDNGKRGRLEVYHDDKWGYVCSQNFDKNEAKVACNMLGFSRAVSVFDHHVELEEKDNIVLSQLQCEGTEYHLSTCTFDHLECPGGVVAIECSD